MQLIVLAKTPGLPVRQKAGRHVDAHREAGLCQKALLANASTASPTGLRRFLARPANSPRPESGQRLAGYAGYSSTEFLNLPDWALSVHFWLSLFQFRVLSFGLFVDGDVGIGVFPEGKKFQVRAARFGGIAP